MKSLQQIRRLGRPESSTRRLRPAARRDLLNDGSLHFVEKESLQIDALLESSDEILKMEEDRERITERFLCGLDGSRSEARGGDEDASSFRSAVRSTQVLMELDWPDGLRMPLDLDEIEMRVQADDGVDLFELFSIGRP